MALLWSIISMAAGLGFGLLLTMYGHEQHISDYAKTSFEDIKDDRKHIVELRDISIHVLVFQDRKTRNVNREVPAYHTNMDWVPVQKIRTIWVSGYAGMIPQTEFYTEMELRHVSKLHTTEKTFSETLIRKNVRVIGYNNNIQIVFDSSVEINSLSYTKIKNITEAKNYIETNIPDFKENITFNNLFKHYHFSGTVYLHGKLVDGKFMCDHISHDKSLIIRKQTPCWLCWYNAY
jgi:hypothetical protein